MENYLKVLEDSLVKKSEVLSRISECNEQQQKVFSAEDPDLDSFDQYIEIKDQLISQLEQLDQGFESLYDKIADQLKENREKYAAHIKTLQTLISRVTDQSVKVQAQEARNKTLIESFFSRKRTEVGDGRRSASAAMNYYKTQYNGNYVPPQFMDSKK